MQLFQNVKFIYLPIIPIYFTHKRILITLEVNVSDELIKLCDWLTANRLTLNRVSVKRRPDGGGWRMADGGWRMADGG